MAGGLRDQQVKGECAAILEIQDMRARLEHRRRDAVYDAGVEVNRRQRDLRASTITVPPPWVNNLRLRAVLPAYR